MTPYQQSRLINAKAHYERQVAAAVQARADLNATIVELVRDGTAQTEVAKTLGVTKAAVNHIVTAHKPEEQ